MRSLPISLNPDGTFHLDTGGTGITIPFDQKGLRLLAHVLAREAGLLATPGAPTKWQAEAILKEMARGAFRPASAEALALAEELGL